MPVLVKMSPHSHILVNKNNYENLVTFLPVQAHSPNACDLLIIFIVLFI